MSEVHITLYGDHADRFNEVQETMENQRGMEVSNAQALRNLLADFD
jgi:hypothetical protein